MVKTLFFSVNDKRLKIWIFLFGCLIGWFGIFYMVRHFYVYTGCVCLFGIHIHHLYFGILISTIASILYHYCQRTKRIRFIFPLIFFIGFGLGLVIDDILDHFVFQYDAWEFFCGACCSGETQGECSL